MNRNRKENISWIGKGQTCLYYINFEQKIKWKKMHNEKNLCSVLIETTTSNCESDLTSFENFFF